MLHGVGFTALDATVLAMTEIMWTFVHINHNLVDPVLKNTIRFLMAPVQLSVISASICMHSGTSVTGHSNGGHLHVKTLSDAPTYMYMYIVASICMHSGTSVKGYSK